MACLAEFLKQYNRLSDVFWLSAGTSDKPSTASACARSGFGYAINQTQSEPESRFNGSGKWGGDTMRSRWSLAIAGLILILAGGVLAYFTQTSGGIQIRDVRFAGAKGSCKKKINKKN